MRDGSIQLGAGIKAKTKEILYSQSGERHWAVPLTLAEEGTASNLQNELGRSGMARAWTWILGHIHESHPCPGFDYLGAWSFGRQFFDSPTPYGRSRLIISIGRGKLSQPRVCSGSHEPRVARSGLGAQAQRNILGIKRRVTASFSLFIGRVKGLAIQ